MVIEDSKGGIQSAVSARAGYVVAIAPKESLSKFDGLCGIDQIASNFLEIDRRLFE